MQNEFCSKPVPPASLSHLIAQHPTITQSGTLTEEQQQQLDMLLLRPSAGPNAPRALPFLQQPPALQQVRGLGTLIHARKLRWLAAAAPAVAAAAMFVTAGGEIIATLVAAAATLCMMHV